MEALGEIVQREPELPEHTPSARRGAPLFSALADEEADGGNGLLSAQYVMPGPLNSYSNIPIPATALSPPLTPPPAPELHQQSRPRFVWTPELHAQFEAACNQLGGVQPGRGLDNAKPMSILKLMDVDSLTLAIIMSHLQKYRSKMNKRSAEAGDGEARPAKAPRVQRRGSSGSVARSSSTASLSRVSSTASFDSSSDAACSPREPAAADAARRDAHH